MPKSFIYAFLIILLFSGLQAQETTYYQLFGVPPNASAKVIRKAWHEKAVTLQTGKWNPALWSAEHKHMGTKTEWVQKCQDAENQLKDLNAAKDILLDETQRRDYDQKLLERTKASKAQPSPYGHHYNNFNFPKQNPGFKPASQSSYPNTPKSGSAPPHQPGASSSSKKPSSSSGNKPGTSSSSNKPSSSTGYQQGTSNSSYQPGSNSSHQPGGPSSSYKPAYSSNFDGFFKDGFFNPDAFDDFFGSRPDDTNPFYATHKKNNDIHTPQNSWTNSKPSVASKKPNPKSPSDKNNTDPNKKTIDPDEWKKPVGILSLAALAYAKIKKINKKTLIIGGVAVSIVSLYVIAKLAKLSATKERDKIVSFGIFNLRVTYWGTATLFRDGFLKFSYRFSV